MKHEITLDASVEQIATVTEFVNKCLAGLGCSDRIRRQIDIAIDEIYGNIARYAYRMGKGPATVCVDVQEDPLCVVITFMDNGVPFDPLAVKAPDTTLPAEERPIGGLGLLMVKILMDDVIYSYEDGKNKLTIRKRI